MEAHQALLIIFVLERKGGILLPPSTVACTVYSELSLLYFVPKITNILCLNALQASYVFRPSHLKPFYGKRGNLKESHKWGIHLPGTDKHAVDATSTENINMDQYYTVCRNMSLGLDAVSDVLSC